jgi:hypothetical protein
MSNRIDYYNKSVTMTENTTLRRVDIAETPSEPPFPKYRSWIMENGWRLQRCVLGQRDHAVASN